MYLVILTLNKIINPFPRMGKLKDQSKAQF